VRPLRLISLLTACCAPIAAVNAASYMEVYEMIHPGDLKIQDTTLNEVMAHPAAYMNVRVRIRCMFIENGTLFDLQHTAFKPDTFLNMYVYDEKAAVWDPQVRAQPVTTLFMSKDLRDSTQLSTLRKYELVDIVSEVAQINDGVAQLRVEALRPVADVGSFSDVSVYHVEQGNALAGESAYDLAEDHYVAALAEKLPIHDRIQVSYLRAKNLMTWAKYNDCVRVLREALALTETSDTDRVTLAAMHYLLAKSMAETTGATTTAEIHAARFSEAVVHARTAVELDPEQGDAYAVLGITLAGMGQFDEARRQCEKAIRLRPNNAEVRWYLGRILDQQGSYEEAIDALRKAIDLTPKDYRIHKALGAVYLHRGQKGGPKAVDDFVTSLREYDIAIRLNPADAESIYGSGQVIEVATVAKAEVQIGTTKVPATFELAIERYKNAVAADGKFLPARRALANRYRASDQPDLAAAQYRAIAEVEPEREENFFDLGRYLWSLGRKEDAYDAYVLCLKSHPNSINTLYILGHIAFETGMYAKGVPWDERLLQLQPGYGPAILDLARLKLALGMSKEALALAEQAEEALSSPADKQTAQAVKLKAQAALAVPSSK
jgi:tetratricopeptide (TPR) repeat protein